jgi:hypothetical protein
MPSVVLEPVLFLLPRCACAITAIANNSIKILHSGNHCSHVGHFYMYKEGCGCSYACATDNEPGEY